MKKKKNQLKRITFFSLMMISFTLLLIGVNPKMIEAVNFGGSTHIGTFDGNTTFMTTSSNGINPGLFIEVMDRYGNLKQYESEEGIITVPDTKEGTYVTQAKLLGKTKYRDTDTNEILDVWEEGRNLELVSVENPELKTVGKNLMYIPSDVEVVNGHNDVTFVNNNGVLSLAGGGDGTDESYIQTNAYVYLERGKVYALSFESDGEYGVSHGTDTVEVYLALNNEYGNDSVFFRIDDKRKMVRVERTGKYYLRLDVNKSNTTHTFYNIQVEESPSVTPYEPYQSNILTVNEEVTLRGVGDVKDELNLLTGELIRKFATITFDGGHDEDWALNNTEETTTNRFIIMIPKSKVANDEEGKQSYLCDKLQKHLWSDTKTMGITIIADAVFLYNKNIDYSINALRNWLQSNPITIQYPLKTESIKTVDLTSTFQFRPVNTRDVYVKGDVEPLVCSVTMPTEALSFVLNPNQEEGKQFIAPEFSITNETPATIQLILKSFEQESDVFNDVLPTEHEDWGLLDQEQSKDIALALVPQPSDGWVELNEGAYYVANHESSVLGRVKGRSTVDFTFEASHGQAFVEKLNPSYKLVFVFDF